MIKVTCFKSVFTSMNALGNVLRSIRLQIIVKNFSRTTAMSFKNSLGNLSIHTISDASMFFKIFGIYSHFHCNKLRLPVNPNF